MAKAFLQVLIMKALDVNNNFKVDLDGSVIAAEFIGDALN